MRKLKQKYIDWFTQGHVASMHVTEVDLSPGVVTSEPVLVGVHQVA